MLSRLAAQAAALEQLSSQHATGVIELVDKYEDTTFVYFVLELMPGGTLADMLKV